MNLLGYLHLLYSFVEAVALNSLISIFHGKSKSRVSVPMKDKIVIVTGSNTGIGKQIATKLYSLGATVVMACRDEKKSNIALLEIKENVSKLSNSNQHNSNTVVADIKFIHLDLSDLSSIPRFVDEFYSTFNHLDVLINNAGLNSEGETKQGLQQLFQVNYLGHYLLTRALIHKQNEINTNTNINNNNKDKASKISKQKLRIVNLSSVTHHFGKLDYKLSSLPHSSCESPYSDSKLYMNFLTYEINKRYSNILNTNSSNSEVIENNANINNNNDSSSDNIYEKYHTLDILAVSVNPGAVASDIWRDWTGIKRFGLKLAYSLFLNVDEGSETAMYGACASADEILSNSSRYSYADSPNNYNNNNKGNCEYQNMTLSDIKNMSLKMKGDKLIPYIIPYNMPKNRPGIGYELIGIFAGPVFSPCGVPYYKNKKGIELASSFLWSFSEDLCKKFLNPKVT